MRDAVLTPRAERDLIEIWAYTARRWSESQADAYLDSIQQAIQLLKRHPEMGPDRGNVRAGYRSIVARSHVIYYQTSPTRILVVRILHRRMDASTHL